jgi:hypothetical protein
LIDFITEERAEIVVWLVSISRWQAPYTANQGKVRKVIPTRELLIGSSKDTWTPRIMLDKPMSAAAVQADALLIKKLNAALRAADEAQAEHVSRSKAVGVLLLEAKKLHPKVKDFEAYLKRVDGLHLSRAYDLMKLAGGRTTEAELREGSQAEAQGAGETKAKAGTEG